VAHEPAAPKGEAILVATNSPIRTLADLKGKKIALNKGSNVHYLLVRALEKADVKYSEIELAFLAPADARAAFERGAVDAWVIWDPYQAAAEVATGARTLADGTGLAPNYQFYFASQKLVDANPGVIDGRPRRPDRRRQLGAGPRESGGRRAQSRDRDSGAGAGDRTAAPELRHQAARCGSDREPAERRRHLLRARTAAEADRGLDRGAEGRLMSLPMPSQADILWFLPTHGDGRYLGTAVDERYEVTREFLAVYRELLAGSIVNHRGKHITIEDGRLMYPPVQQPHPPLFFGGSSDVANDVAAESIDKYLTWGEPPSQVGEKINHVAALAAAKGRRISFGIRLHVIVRETKAEAWRAADDLISHVSDDAIANAQTIFTPMDSVGQRRMTELHGGRRDRLEVSPGLWAGVGLVRGGAGTALVGDPQAVSISSQARHRGSRSF
jgi:hypothetical protein